MLALNSLWELTAVTQTPKLNLYRIPVCHLACLHEHDSAKQIDLKIQILNRCILRQNRIIRSSLHVSLTIVLYRFNE